jgi:diguanylate cyclase (GGDEF)-like protein
MTLLTAVYAGFFSLYPMVMEKDTVKFLVYLGVALAEFCIFLLSWDLSRKETAGDSLVPVYYLCFFLILMFFGIYIGVLNNKTPYAINFMVFLICSQLIYVSGFLTGLALNLAVLSVFSFATLWFKGPRFAMVDISNAVFAALLAMTFKWNISHILIGRMLAIRRLEEERNRFQEESIRDVLTGISNRRDFQHTVQFYISVCRHVHQTVCALMLDVDYFKRYNDHYGHPKGDTVLQSLGQVLKRLMEEEHAFAARVGGEEFIVLWTENRIAEAERVARRLRQMVIDLQIPHEVSGVAPWVTVSLGLYVLRGGSLDTAEELYSQADVALYEAKGRGRNCIVLLDSDTKEFRMVELVPPEQNLGRR